jgi:GTP-binding protein
MGLRSRLLTATQGEAFMHHVFSEYQPTGGEVPRRQSGVMVATHSGRVTPFALDALYERGVFFVRPGDEVYEGQIVGEVGQEKDISVNAVKTKHLTNIRSSTKEDGMRVRPPREMSLELALEFIQEDEQVDVTPSAVRLRKKVRSANDRRRAARGP